MKKVLMSVQGYIHQIVDPGEDFEIYDGPDATIQWVDAPDDVTLDWTLEWSPSANQMVWVKREEVHTDPVMARKVAYGDIGDQLDMMYKDALDGGTRWIDHVRSVKESLPPPPVQEEAMTLDQLMDFSANAEPDVSLPVGLSTQECPAWKRYPGWKGYETPTVD